MDPVLQAFTGLMIDNKGEDGIPHRVPFVVIDMSTALYAFQALSAALYARRDLPQGRHIAVILLEAASAMQVIRTMMVYLEGQQVRRSMPSGVFRTEDGWLQFLIVRQQQWLSLCGVLEMPQLAATWPERLSKADIMHERLNSFREFLTQPQVEAIDLIGWLKLAEAPEPIPVPNIAGIAKLADGTPRATTP